MFCCNRLQACVVDPGDAGFRVLVRRAPEYFTFHLQVATGASSDDDRGVQAPLGVAVKLTSTVAIAFCPWCGRRLHDLAKRAPGGFAELARRHEPVFTAL